MRRILPYLPASLATLLIALAAPVLMLADAPLTEDGPVLVLAAPKADLGQLIAEAGGWIVGVEQAPIATLAFSPDPGFAMRLKELGAWAVLDGTVASWLCGVKINGNE